MPEVFYQQLHNAPLGPSAARRLGARNLVGRSTVSPLPRGASYARLVARRAGAARRYRVGEDARRLDVRSLRAVTARRSNSFKRSILES